MAEISFPHRWDPCEFELSEVVDESDYLIFSYFAAICVKSLKCFHGFRLSKINF